MKKILLAALPLLALSAFAPLTNVQSGHVSVTRQSNRSLDIKSEYVFNTTFNVPSLVKDGITYGSSFVFPDGTATRSTSVLLNQAGKYELHYTAVNNGVYDYEDYSFTVQNPYYTFTGTQSFANYENTDRTYDKEGLYVSLASGESMTFSEPLDLRTTTKKDILFQVFAVPTVVSTEDYSQLEFVLTDVSDPSCYLTLNAKATPDGTEYPYTYWKAGGNDQDMVGIEGGTNIHVNNDFGCPVLHSFSGRYPGGQTIGDPVLNIEYDADENAVYTNSGATMVTDLDNTKYASTAWDGFKSGMARLTITAKAYTADTAQFVIKNIRGLMLTKTIYSDTEAPEISVDCPYDVLPDAVVGRSYPVFPAAADDNISGSVDVRTTVYHVKNSRGYAVTINDDNTFDVKSSGTYKIVYEATDAAGNTSNKVLTVATTDTDTPISIVPKAKISTSVKKGVYYELPDFKVSGGTGNFTTEYEVLYNGKPVEITDGKFLPTELGVYTVSFTATDMTKKSETYSFDVYSEYNDGVVFYDTPELPKYFISGYGYELPAIYGTDFGNNQAKILAEVEIDCGFTKQIVQSGTYFQPDVASNGDGIKITYRAKDAELVYYIPCIKSYSGKELQLQNYFIGEGFGMDMAYNDKTVVTSTVNGTSGWQFANAVAAEGLTLSMGFVSGLSTFTGFEYVFTDKVNSDEKVTVSLYQSGKIVFVKVGDTLLKTDFAFSSDTDVTVKISDGTFNFNKLSAAIKTFDNGKTFTGFSSDFVYLSVNMTGASAGTSGYEIYRIDNQAICETVYDSIEPRITVLDTYGGFMGIGSTSTTARILVSDVLDPNSHATVTVTDPEHNVISDADGQPINGLNPSRSYSISLDSYGQYAVKYVAADSTGNESTFAYSIGVLDDIDPEIKITSGYATEGKVGEAIIVPTYTVSDNYDAPEDITTYVNVRSPSGTFYVLPTNSNSFVPKYTGNYEVTITAIDTAGNMATFTYTVAVK